MWKVAELLLDFDDAWWPPAPAELTAYLRQERRACVTLLQALRWAAMCCVTALLVVHRSAWLDVAAWATQWARAWADRLVGLTAGDVALLSGPRGVSFTFRLNDPCSSIGNRLTRSVSASTVQKEPDMPLRCVLGWFTLAIMCLPGFATAQTGLSGSIAGVVMRGLSWWARNIRSKRATWAFVTACRWRQLRRRRGSIRLLLIVGLSLGSLLGTACTQDTPGGGATPHVKHVTLPTHKAWRVTSVAPYEGLGEVELVKFDWPTADDAHTAFALTKEGLAVGDPICLDHVEEIDTFWAHPVPAGGCDALGKPAPATP